jgi:hypothetical protein
MFIARFSTIGDRISGEGQKPVPEATGPVLSAGVKLSVSCPLVA